MREVLYWEEAHRLVYLEAKATPEFWDSRWIDEGKPTPVSPKDDVITVTRKFLSPGDRVLEGGCGRANKVKAMADVGFDAIGVDFAKETVHRAREMYNGIDVREGDVRALAFPDGYFDGYWSIGVIEHFWDGYDEILSEACRVLKPGGFLFLTAPWFSPYRQAKARDGGYKHFQTDAEPELFYQFALGRNEVIEQLARNGFAMRAWRGRVSEISMRSDMMRFRGFIEWLLGSRGSIPKRALRKVVARALDNYCGHSFLAVAQRVK